MTIRLYLESVLFSLLINTLIILIFRFISKDACKKGNLDEYLDKDTCETVRKTIATTIISTFIPVWNVIVSLFWVCLFIGLLIWNGVKIIVTSIIPDK